jgi:hypothetical protein
VKPHTQTYDEIANSLQILEVDWKSDPHAEAVMSQLRKLPIDTRTTKAHVIEMLSSDFRVGTTVLRLVLEMSRDEWDRDIPALFDGTGAGKVTQFRADPEAYVETLDERLDLLNRLNHEIHRPLHWHDRLVGLFQGGWGSARKGQLRGLGLEDFVESIAKEVFNPEQIAMRCSFVGADGRTRAKADLAIPSAQDPRIVIEVKAFGATGSKQSNVLGDASEIIAAKRHDTVFLIVTDGITWRKRAKDLRRLIEFQNVGKIYRIYTKKMADELRSDLETLKIELCL